MCADLEHDFAEFEVGITFLSVLVLLLRWCDQMMETFDLCGEHNTDLSLEVLMAFDGIFFV